MYTENHTTQISNVLVIGCGGAGLRAAIEVKLAGLDVQVLGKRPKIDSHTVLAAGGINAALIPPAAKTVCESVFARFPSTDT